MTERVLEPPLSAARRRRRWSALLTWLRLPGSVPELEVDPEEMSERRVHERSRSAKAVDILFGAR